MKREMIIEYLMCRADLNFEVDFRVKMYNHCTYDYGIISVLVHYTRYILVSAVGTCTHGLVRTRANKYVHYAEACMMQSPR